MTTDPHEPLWPVEGCVLAADFHLDGTSAATGHLEAVLRIARDRGHPLVLLGDLFDYWFGPKQLAVGTYEREIALLRDFTASGLTAKIIPGNRDFLLDRQFSAQTGVEVLGDALYLQLPNELVHLSHGDLFATWDVRYLRMRRVLRSQMVEFLARHLPTLVVERLARRLRRHSERVVRQKPAAVLEPDRQAVAELVAGGADTVICGHYHRWIDETVTAESRQGRFVVLEPGDRGAFAFCHDGTGWERVTGELLA